MDLMLQDLLKYLTESGGEVSREQLFRLVRNMTNLSTKEVNNALNDFATNRPFVITS